MEGLELPKWLEYVIAGIISILGKVGWDKHRRSHTMPPIDGGEVSPESQVTRRDSVMIWLTDRIHKVKDEINVPILRHTSMIETLVIRTARNEDDVKQLRIDLNEKLASVHQHIESVYAKIDKKIDEARIESRESMTRIWGKLDREP